MVVLYLIRWGIGQLGMSAVFYQRPEFAHYGVTGPHHHFLLRHYQLTPSGPPSLATSVLGLMRVGDP